MKIANISEDTINLMLGIILRIVIIAPSIPVIITPRAKKRSTAAYLAVTILSLLTGGC